MRISKNLIKDDFVVDYYVPITVNFPENEAISSIQYYRFINSSSSFIELKIDAKTKKITEIVVVNINDIEETDMKFDTKFYGEFKINIGSESVITENIDFKFYKGDREIFFIIKDKNIESINQISHHVSFFVDSDSTISGILFKNFSSSDWKIIEDSIKNK